MRERTSPGYLSRPHGQTESVFLMISCMKRQKVSLKICGGAGYLPIAFTEQGVTMLSGVLITL